MQRKQEIAFTPSVNANKMLQSPFSVKYSSKRTVTLNAFYPFFYFSSLLPKCTPHSVFYSPLISALESVLYYMNVPCAQHKEFTSAARTPVTNHVFRCTLPFSLLMSNSAQNTPPHLNHLHTLCWENDYYSCCTLQWCNNKGLQYRRHTETISCC